MENQQQPTVSNITVPQAPRTSNTGLVIAIVILSVIVFALAGLSVWLFIKDSTSDASSSSSSNAIVGSEVADSDANDTVTQTESLKTATIVAAKSGTKFSLSYPDTWTLTTDGYTKLSPVASATGSTDKTEIIFSGTTPQSAGCAMLNSNYTIKYYDTAPITGWQGNSYVGLYETDGSTWCYLSGLVATKDSAFATGQTADKLYLQGASNHPSIDTSASSGDQVYAVSFKSFTSEAQAMQYVESDEYLQQKKIIQSLTVVK